MNERYSNAFIDSSIQYLFNLRKLARQDAQTLKDLSTLEILLQVYNWADWFEVSENDKIHIQKLLDCIYLRNPKLVLPTVIPGTYYSNVSTPQTIWTWQRIWDNLDGTIGIVPGETYYINISPLSSIQSSTAGSTTYTVSANTTWSASSNQPWCTLSINGNTITATYTSNILATSRTATITITDTGGHSVVAQTATLTQAAAITTLAVTPASRSVGASSGTTTFSVVSNATWTVTSNAAWCTATSSGTGNGTINVTYAQNLENTSRTAILTITAPGAATITVEVIQGWTSTYLDVTPSSRTISASTTSTTFNVSSNTTWITAVIGTTEWCSATLSGSNNGTINVTCTENPSITSRSVIIRVTAPNLPSVEVQVIQNGIGTSLSITPLTRSVSSDGGTTTFAITSNAVWSASSNVNWCTIPTSGSGNSTLTCTYSANTLENSRTAIITVSVLGIAPIQLTVVQDAFVPVGELEILQGYIYSMPALFDSRKITSSDAWVVANTSPQDSVNPSADYTHLRNYVTPEFLELLHDFHNRLGFNAYNTSGRLGTGAFTTAGQYPEGSILMSPYSNQNNPSNCVVTFVGNPNDVPTMTTYEIPNISFPVRLVKRNTTLSNGDVGTYVGNNNITYPTICINGREWLAVNLIETNYRNGDSIPEITDTTAWSRNIGDLIGQRCSYQNDEEYAFIRNTR